MTHQRILQEDGRRIDRINRLLCYGMALLCVALALGITLLLSPWLYPTPTPLFFVAVIASAWSGGLGAGLLASILSTLAIDYFSIEPIYSLHLANLGTILRLSMFLTVAVLLGWFERSRDAALENAEANCKSLQEKDEAELRHPNQTLKTPIVAIDADNTVRLWNPAATQLFGWCEAEVLDRPLPIDERWSNPKFKIQNPKLQVSGDAGRLQQVVWNLLSNAVKFTPHGGQVAVALTQTGTHAQIQVVDIGIGINPDFLPYVFEHFRQEDGATTRKFGGLGLGLAIAHQIVEMHGGTIAVESQGEGQGATFTVQIPLAPQSSKLPIEASSDLTGDLSGIYILVVDDEPDSREFVAFVLEQAGAIVTSVSLGIEALQAIERSVPNLIVSDVGMPEMDGYMLLRQIPTRSPASQVPAIALTAYAGEFNHALGLTAGFQHHLAKPVEPTEIVSTLARWREKMEANT